MGVHAWVRAGALAPALRATTFAARGFPVQPSEAVARLEAIPQAVVCGLEWGLAARDLWELEHRLALVDDDNRGFAYEGATMGLTLLDALVPGRATRTHALMEGPGRPYTLLNLIGIGFAMSHLPRPAWRGVIPQMEGNRYHPVASWLAVDGYGFDQAYFHTEQVVHRQRRPKPYPWEGEPEYFLRAVDQGIGRALWFIHGGRPQAVAAAVGRFAPTRQLDLWSGVGLAATFAGGAEAAGLESLRRQAGPAAGHLAQGAAFAALGRCDAGMVPEHTERAAAALTGTPAERLAALVRDAVDTTRRTEGITVGYETVRRIAREHLERVHR